jgi:AraC family transcriptional regulator
LPAGSYAVFTVTGGLPKLGDMFMYAYQTWIPSSNYVVAYPNDYEFYEVDRFKDGQVPDSELEIYIPVKPK